MPDEPFKRLGTPRVIADQCSLCDKDLTEDEHMPLVLRTGDKEMMWVYCAKCEKVIHQIVPRRR